MQSQYCNKLEGNEQVVASEENLKQLDLGLRSRQGEKKWMIQDPA